MLQTATNVPITFQWFTSGDGNSVRHACNKSVPPNRSEMVMAIDEDKALMFGGSFVASMNMQVMLIRWAARQDPGFLEEALASHDDFVGRIQVQGELPTELMVKGREIFRQMIQTLIEIRATEPATAAATSRQKSLRRRFLNWLERG